MIETMEMEAAARAGLFPFVRPMLREMEQEGIGAAVITRNCARAVATVFPDAMTFCQCLLTRDHVERVKPDPEHLLCALEVLDCPPEHCLMVGDHPLDIETGRRAGAWTAGVAGGRVGEEELRRHGADITAPDCRVLVDRLKARGWQI
jgi:phosphoglycolate phosphatase